jgi:hypothetical protein
MRGKSKSRLETSAALLVTLVLGAWVAGAAAAEPTHVCSSGLFELGDGLQPAGLAGTAQILARPDTPGPAWSDLFGADGWARDDYPASGDGAVGNGEPDYRELYGGRWVAFSADNEDAAPGFEPSARGGSDGLVVNGFAAPAQDLDSLLGYVTSDPAGRPVLYLAASRAAAGSTVVDLELNQDFVRVGKGGWGQGLPWTLSGARMEGDLRIRLEFSGAGLASAAVERWQPGESGAGWQPVEALAGEGCNSAESFCVLTNGSEIESAVDIAGASRILAAGSFVAVGLGLDGALTSLPDYVTLRASTPQDLAFAYFSTRGR